MVSRVDLLDGSLGHREGQEQRHQEGHARCHHPEASPSHRATSVTPPSSSERTLPPRDPTELAGQPPGSPTLTVRGPSSRGVSPGDQAKHTAARMSLATISKERGGWDELPHLHLGRPWDLKRWRPHGDNRDVL